MQVYGGVSQHIEMCLFQSSEELFAVSWCLLYPSPVPWWYLSRLQASHKVFIPMLLPELDGTTCLRSSQGAWWHLELDCGSESQSVPLSCGVPKLISPELLSGRESRRQNGLMYLFLLPVFSFRRTRVSMLILELLMKLRSSE